MNEPGLNKWISEKVWKYKDPGGYIKKITDELSDFNVEKKKMLRPRGV